MYLNPMRLVADARDDDRGAVAVIVALMSVLLFSMGALAIDLGNGYARKRASQTTADLAALAGAAQLGVAGGVTEARKAAIDFVRTRNVTASDDGVTVPDCAVTSPTAPVCWDNDGNLDNGEITFSDDTGVATRGIGATRIRVVTPRREVSFGLAGIMGFSKVTVTKAATAGIFSPGGAAAPPFYLTATDKGLTCVKDDSPGVGNHEATRAAFYGLSNGARLDSFTTPSTATATEGTATPFTIKGNQLGGATTATFRPVVGGASSIVSVTPEVANNAQSVSGTTAATLAPGAYKVKVSDATESTNEIDFTVEASTSPPPAPSTLSSISPTSGPELTATGFTLTGSGFGTNASQVAVTFGSAQATITGVTNTTITGTTPATVAAGTVGVQAFVSNVGSSNTENFQFTPAPAPVISIDPNSGPDTATAPVVISGTNLTTATAANIFFGAKTVVSIVSRNGTSITVMPPTGTAGSTVDVVVYNGSTASNAVPYTYFADPTSCPGTSSNRGYLDEPRFTSNAQSLQLNVQQGIDHGLHTYQTYLLPADAPPRATPATSVECGSLAAGTVLESGSVTPLPNINCVRMRTGNIAGSLEQGFFDDNGSPNPGRMYHLDPGATTGTIGGYAGVDIDDLFDSKFVDPANLVAFKAAMLAGTDPTPAQEGWLKDAVLRCPRFAILPITNAPDDPPNGTTYYPITGFKGLFITSVAADTSAEHGFTFGGGSLKVVKGFVFDLRWISSTISSTSVGDTTEFIGTGPRIAKLIRDVDDGSY